MPWGLTRFHHSGQSHFVTFCCYHRSRLLTTDASRRIFESALERVRRSFKLRVYGYAIMPEHVHLLLSEPQRETLADALKSLKQGVSRRLIGKLPLKPKPGLSGPPVALPGATAHANHWADLFEISRRRTWPSHIQSPERTITGTKTNRVAGA